MSFEKSGVPIKVVDTYEDGPPCMLWQRDPYFMMGGKAFFPDPKKMEAYLRQDKIDSHQIITTRRDAWEQCYKRLKSMGIKTIIVEGCYFEGGNLIPDIQTGFLFCGVKDGNYKRENIQLLCQDIEMHTDIRLKPTYIPTDGNHHPHLDMGCSERMPNGKFLICKQLGQAMNGEGYKKLVEYIGQDFVIPYTYSLCNAMAANLTAAADMVMLPDCEDNLYQRLSSEGLQVNVPQNQHVANTRYELPDVAPTRVIGRGGVHCFTNVIR